MLSRLRQARTVTCPECKGEGYVSASPIEWEQWVRAHTAAAAEHERVLVAYQAGRASRVALDAAVGAITDQTMSAPDGHVCEACQGYGVQVLQRRRVGLAVRPLLRRKRVARWAT